MERIQRKGKSIVLTELADRDGAVEKVPISSPSRQPSYPEPPSPVKPVVPDRVIVQCDDDFMSLDEDVEAIEVRSGVCNNEAFDRWKVYEYEKLRELIVGDECFQYVKDLKIVGLNELKKVEIGKQCFCKTNGGEFVLKDCEKLESVKIGDGSFVGVMNVVFESECRVVC